MEEKIKQILKWMEDWEEKHKIPQTNAELAAFIGELQNQVIDIFSFELGGGRTVIPYCSNIDGIPMWQIAGGIGKINDTHGFISDTEAAGELLNIDEFTDKIQSILGDNYNRLMSGWDAEGNRSATPIPGYDILSWDDFTSKNVMEKIVMEIS